MRIRLAGRLFVDGFLPYVASVVSEVQPPSFKLPVVAPKSRPPAEHPHAGPSRRSASPPAKPAPDSSATEYSTDDERNKGKAPDRSSRVHSTAESRSGSPAQPNSEEGRSSSRPSKKAKKSDSSDSDSDDDTPEARRRRLAQLKRGSVGSNGVRQPIKRGGKRF